jgi:hypothetical protein
MMLPENGLGISCVGISCAASSGAASSGAIAGGGGGGSSGASSVEMVPISSGRLPLGLGIT